jgi:hypothetical protein
MAVRRKSPQTVVLDASQNQEVENTTAPEQSIVETFSDDLHAALCPGCGEPLAWHEEDCTRTPAPLAIQPEEVPAVPDSDQGLAPVPFAYILGQPVQPTVDARPHKIVWRGQVKERHPRSGLVRRVNVYRLDNGFWDCYYEAELQAA